MINIKEDKKLMPLNHSCAHLLAEAVKKLYPEAKFWVGPVIEDGFYYDIDLGDKTLTDDDLPIIEKEMKKIAKGNKKIIRHELTRKEALDKFKDDPYKIDLINNMSEDEVITCYTQGDFTDLCRGPHVESTKELRHFKLLRVSGAYFKGDSKNKMLQRIYGVCYESEEDLNKHLEFLEEAKKRDHKKLGKELGLFMISEYGPGFPFFLPNGMILRNILENFWYEEHTKEGYEFIKTPIMLNQELWEKSGHWANYRENMYNGEEVINYNCKDPRPEVKEYDIFRNKEQTYQTYYMRGYDAGNYACERYLEKKVTTGDEFDQAYKCCLEAQQSVCIYQYEKNNMATFCSIYDNTCKSSNTGNVEFKVFKNSSITDGVEASKRYCIKTYNLCPYNFNVEFGSDDKSVVFERIATEESMEKCQNSDDYANCDIKYEKDDCTDANGETYPFCEGKNKNFLQYNRHCTIVDGGNIVEFTYTNTYSPYIDKSCINLIAISL